MLASTKMPAFPAVILAMEPLPRFLWLPLVRSGWSPTHQWSPSAPLVPRAALDAACSVNQSVSYQWWSIHFHGESSTRGVRNTMPSREQNEVKIRDVHMLVKGFPGSGKVKAEYPAQISYV